jgi:anti-anti-sigma factor
MGPRERFGGVGCSAGRTALMNAPRSVQFEIAVDFDADQTIVHARGDVDLLTAPTLHAAMNALVDQSRVDIVLELAGLTFMDASGLRVIADISARLATSSRELIVRSAPSMTRRILELTHVSDLIRLEAIEPTVAPLGVEQRAGDHSRAVEAGSVKLSADLLRIVSKSTNDAIDAALGRVVALVGATMEGADGVSVTLERDGRLATVASSNDTVMKMDIHQYETGEGPCLSAAAEGHWFHIESLADEARWPIFVPLAMDEGIASILSTPLMAERSLGALNIYSNSERAFTGHQQEVAALFASQASAILADAGFSHQQMGKPLADALLARQVISRAQGVLMARANIAPADAAAAIHRSARAAGVTVAHQAATIVASTQHEVPSVT